MMGRMRSRATLWYSDVVSHKGIDVSGWGLIHISLQLWVGVIGGENERHSSKSCHSLVLIVMKSFHAIILTTCSIFYSIQEAIYGIPKPRGIPGSYIFIWINVVPMRPLFTLYYAVGIL